MKKSLTAILREIVFPKETPQDKKEVDMLNVVVLRRISFLCALLELVAFIVAVSGVAKVENKSVSVYSTAIGTILCIAMNAFLRYMDHKKYYNHYIVVTLCNSFSILFILWSMSVSGYKYTIGAQIITFYAVVVALISFIVMMPHIGISIVAAAFIGFYIFMYSVDKAQNVQTFNYFAFMLICCGAVVAKHGITIAEIRGKQHAEELSDAYAKIMRYDPLSHVKNRNALTDDICEYYGRKITVIIFDLDNFKAINDTYGHIAGDKVIAAYGKAFTDVFGEEYVYRFGGDEFLVVREITQDEFARERTALRETVNKMTIDGIDERADYSYGYAVGTINSGADFEELTTRADNMLYEQKKEKHNPRRSG